MKKNTGIIIGVIALIVIAGAAYASMGFNNNGITEEKMDESVVMQKENDEMVKEDSVMKKDEMMKKDSVMMKGSYEVYASEKLARAETGDVVLFFHASWCPSCRSLNSDIEANAGSIPEGVSILKVDYDTGTELKKKYGVTTQHTLVQVDKDGNIIKKWSGGSKLSNLVSEIQ